MEQPERLAGRSLAQDLVELVQDAGGAAAHDLAPQEADGLHRILVDGEAQAGSQRHRPQHPNRILAEAHRGVADGADHFPLEVLKAAHPVDDRESGDVVEESVDREVPAEGVLFRRAEGVVAADERVAFFRLGLPAESRHLDDLPAEAHVAEAEAAANDETVAKQFLDLLGMSGGPDVEVFGPAFQEKVAHSPPHEISHESVVLQTIKHLEGIGVDVLAGDNVLGAGEYPGRDVPGGGFHSGIIPAGAGSLPGLPGAGPGGARPPGRDRAGERGGGAEQGPA